MFMRLETILMCQTSLIRSLIKITEEKSEDKQTQSQQTHDQILAN